MPQLIVYPNEFGAVSICYPTPDCGIPVAEIARKDIPAGTPYLILDAALIPTDHTFFEAFECDFSAPHGYGIGHDAWVAEQLSNEGAA